MTQTEFFVVTESFPAPFIGDMQMKRINSVSAQALINNITIDERGRGRANWYHHPSGLHAVKIYDSADNYHKRRPALIEWYVPV